jgi:hypothetical protein
MSHKRECLFCHHTYSVTFKLKAVKETLRKWIEQHQQLQTILSAGKAQTTIHLRGAGCNP